MNRKERRASRKQAKVGLSQGIGPAAVSRNLFVSAIEHFNAGRMDDAERLCRDVLMFDRGHFDATRMLGLIAAQVGNYQAAIELFGRALAVNDRNADCRFDLAQALAATGRERDAIGHLTAATELKPTHMAAHLMLADMLVAHNEIDQAQAHYERVLAEDSRVAEAWHGIANILRLKGRLDEAAGNFRMVISLRPDFAEAYSNLGVVLAAQGLWAEAVEKYQQAISIKPQLVDVYRNLARALLMDGHAEPALAAVMRGLAIGETEEGKAVFVQCAQEVANLPGDDAFRNLIARALTEGWGRASELSAVAATLIKASPTVQRALQPGGITPDGMSALDDRLLLALLVSAPVRDAELERFLTAVRAGLLHMAMQADGEQPVGEHLLAFGCALASQCFINEYVFAATEAEAEQAAALFNQVDAVVASIAPIHPFAVAACGCYAPLHSLKNAAAFLSRLWLPPLDAVIVQQVREPAAERGIRVSIPGLTPIEDAISRRVREQYEAMPYPRWIKAASVGRPAAIDWYLRGQLPTAPIRPYQTSTAVDVLVAGCGTGQHAIETAQRFTGARVLAIDLSRTSLGYAIRKTREAGLRNIQYAQADILQLGSLPQSFDVIEASGVLHHLGDPAQGWRVLLSLLRPGGFLHVGLYSALARADVRVACAFIAERGYGNSAADIRRCRQEMLAQPDGSPLKTVATFGDFFTISECRDLLFHVQEHQLTIPQIKEFLEDNGLTFLGFTGPVAQAYRRRFPNDPALTDLDQWHVFETEHPDAFVNMYQFWMQKAGVAAV